jgi:hypothetical protein
VEVDEIFEHETGTDFIGENEYDYLMVGALIRLQWFKLTVLNLTEVIL